MISDHSIKYNREKCSIKFSCNNVRSTYSIIIIINENNPAFFSESQNILVS